MAALQKIRSKAGLLIGVIAVALLAFIFPWSELTSFMNRQRDKAFVVDGEVVSTGNYIKRINDFESFQKIISGQSTLDENTTAQIREYVYQQMVKEIMLNGQAEKLGLAVSDEELRDMTVGTNISPILRQLPLFVDPQTGQFSPQAFNQFLNFVNTDINSIPLQQSEQRAQLQNLKDVWTTIQNLIKYQRLEEKYNALLANAIIVNDIEAKANVEASKSTSDIAYVVNRYSSVPDSTVSVSEKEIEKLYSTRKNNFKNREDLRKITYITKEITPSESDYAAVEKEINEAREKLLTTENPALIVTDYSELPYHDIFFSESNLSPIEANFVKSASIGDVDGPIRDGETYRLYKLVDRTSAPDSVKLRIISIPEGVDRTAANNRADSLINVIKQGKDFGIVANELMPQSNGGDTGWLTEPQLISGGKEFVSGIFSTLTGEIKKLNTQGQIFIVKVEDKTKPVTKYKLALIQMPVVVSDQTLAGIDNELNEFVAKNSDGKNFVAAANEKGYNLSQDFLITGSLPGIGQIRGSRQVINWAFNEKVGSVKKFDLSDYKIVALINSKIDAGYIPLSEVSDILKDELIKDKKAEKMITDMKAKNLTSLDAYADALESKVDTAKFVTFNTPNITNIGRETALNVYAGVGQLNKLEGPVKGDNGVLVMNIYNRVDQSTDVNTEAYKRTIGNQNMYRIMSQSMETLKEKMSIEDNRVRFF